MSIIDIFCDFVLLHHHKSYNELFYNAIKRIILLTLYSLCHKNKKIFFNAIILAKKTLLRSKLNYKHKQLKTYILSPNEHY